MQNINARFFLRRLQSGRILLVKNGPPTERLQKRTHLSAYLSEDDGQTWKGGLLLDERNAVSYPDGFESPDGLIHVLYDWNRHTDAEILLAKFREEDVLAGKIVSKDAKLLQLANKASGPKPEKLYNGIELPDQWPPRFRDANSNEPMEVPYLKNKPKVVRIDVGRQLFVDDFLIEKTTLQRTFHQAKKFEGNPVFKAETERELGPATQGERGEEATTFTGQGGVFYDPAEKLFKMFYVAGWRGPLSLATSPDMKTWTRRGELLPEGLRWTGPKLVTGGSDNCVWLDLNAKNPSERLKYLTCWEHVPKEQRPTDFHHSLHVSDGKTWSDGVPTTFVADDYCSFFYNPFREKWVFSIKKNTARGRSRNYFESADFLNGADWNKSVYWTNADRLDAPEPAGRYPGAGDTPQLYSLNAVAYESLIVGMHYIHRGPKNEICEAGKFPKLLDLELGFIARVLDWGAHGIMVPHVNSAAEAEAIVQAAHYPPRGRRGYSRTVRAHDYGLRSPEQSPTPVIMAQIESIEGVNHAVEIAQIKGVDVLFVGPADLQHDLIHSTHAAPGDFTECLNLVVAAAKGAGKETGILVRDPADVPHYLGLGFTQIAIDSDLAILRKSWQQTLFTLDSQV